MIFAEKTKIKKLRAACAKLRGGLLFIIKKDFSLFSSRFLKYLVIFNKIRAQNL